MRRDFYMSTQRSDRLSKVDGSDLRPDSLVGSYFHSDAKRGWQGCIVAEIALGVYLVETFDWILGSSHTQSLVYVDDMLGWSFYDDAEWMNNDYEHGGVRERWEQERAGAQDG
jgi:hypothetical protein